MSQTSPTKLVYSADRTEAGVRTGGSRLCSMHGCTGMRIAVRWPDGKLTYPCTKGLVPSNDGSMQIAS
jgi:hypothetical protein